MIHLPVSSSGFFPNSTITVSCLQWPCAGTPLNMCLKKSLFIDVQQEKETMLLMPVYNMLSFFPCCFLPFCSTCDNTNFLQHLLQR